MLSGCQNASIQTWLLKDIMSYNNIACRLITKNLSNGFFGGNIIFTDIGSETWMAQQCLVLPANAANVTPMASTKLFSK